MLKLAVATVSAFALAISCAERTGSHPNAETIAIGGEQISASGLNVSTNSGADRILRRFRMATRAACDVQFGSRAVVEVAREQGCVDQTMARAVAELGSRTVAVRYARYVADQTSWPEKGDSL